MNAPARRRATYEDVLNAPPHHTAQVIFGELYTMPRPAVPHARTALGLGVLLGGPFHFGIGGPGGWILLSEPELHLGADPDILVPDLAGWRRDRERLPEEDAKWISCAPDWVCEVLSPSTQKLDRTEKMAVYLREGVGHVWLVDPVAHTLEVYRHAGAAWTPVVTHGGAMKVQAEPFAENELDLARLWKL